MQGMPRTQIFETYPIPIQTPNNQTLPGTSILVDRCFLMNVTRWLGMWDADVNVWNVGAAKVIIDRPTSLALKPAPSTKE